MRRSGRHLALPALLALCVAAAVAPVTAATAPTAGPAGHDAPEPDVTVDVADLDGETVWYGQVVRIEGFAGGEAVVLERSGTAVDATADDGALVLDSSDLEPGEWRVVGEESGAGGTVDVRRQELSASVDADRVSAGAFVTLNVTSPRDEYGVRVTVEDYTDEPVAAGDLQYVFPDDATVRDDHVVVEGDASIELDTLFLNASEHTVTVDVVDADATARTNLSVLHGTPSTYLRIDEPPERVGDTLAFHVNQSGPGHHDEFWVRIADEREWYDVTIHVVDVENYREPVRITWDSGAALADDGGFTVESNARLADVETSGRFFTEETHRSRFDDVRHELRIGETWSTGSDPLSFGLGTDTLTVEPAEDPALVLNASAPADATVEDDPTLHVRVENEGGPSDPRAFDVRIDGEAVPAEPVELAADGVATRSYDLPTDDPGVVPWNVSVADHERNGTLRVAAGDPTGEDRPGNDTVGDGELGDRSGSAGDEAPRSGDDGDGGAGPREDEGGAADDAVPGFGALAALGGALVAALLGTVRSGRRDGEP